MAKKYPALLLPTPATGRGVQTETVRLFCSTTCREAFRNVNPRLEPMREHKDSPETGERCCWCSVPLGR